ncbi:MAG: DUF2789 domain-containing protein [Thiomicrorhabdus chilensis]|uniref:DUF2789 domain-containing protein n=1 Tax=Thiomicrorhabdus chilensis TaxID=63656 RepID=UPI00299DA235|nr:DUF2789 domain-containing protein [Thiomicrorhabdus chilensis]MDX1347816.1 DUF2789 domain-containing protein [Thiomicrorhabdus chilensis]
MEAPVHSLNALFEQLGLPSSESEIETFIETHKTIAKTTPLAQASFWTPSQAAFLAEAINNDADWAEVVDQLDTMLRA